jgi:hypothetical protein
MGVQHDGRALNIVNTDTRVACLFHLAPV